MKTLEPRWTDLGSLNPARHNKAILVCAGLFGFLFLAYLSWIDGTSELRVISRVIVVVFLLVVTVLWPILYVIVARREGKVRVCEEGVELADRGGVARLPWSIVDAAEVTMTLKDENLPGAKGAPVETWDSVELRYKNRRSVRVNLSRYRKPREVCERIMKRLPVTPRFIYWPSQRVHHFAVPIDD